MKTNWAFSQLRPIDYSLYLREKIPTADETLEENESLTRLDGSQFIYSFALWFLFYILFESVLSNLNEIFDQKNYLEEVNKKLE